MSKNKRKEFIGKREMQILDAIAKVGLFTASIAAPNLIKLYPFLFPKQTAREKSYFSEKIEEFSRDDIIFLGGEKIELTAKGRKLLKLNQELLIDLTPEKWDGIWRVIAYDIPKKYSKERNYFQRKLSQSGFARLQKSVWIIPFECKENIAVFAQNVGISPYVLYLTTEEVPENEKYLIRFGLD